MRTWTDIGSDVDWAEYGGRWAKADPTYAGRYYVIEFVNMEDACGSNAPYKYVCSVKQVDLTEIPKEEIEKALDSCGATVDSERYVELVNVEACVSYGVAAPMEEFTSNTYAGRLRATARRYAEKLMRDESLVQDHLSQPVNKIGSTARDFGRGDILAGLRRYAAGQGDPSQSKDTMLTMYGRRDLARS